MADDPQKAPACGARWTGYPAGPGEAHECIKAAGHDGECWCRCDAAKRITLDQRAASKTGPIS